jgi:hypothetical protein
MKNSRRRLFEDDITTSPQASSVRVDFSTKISPIDDVVVSYGTTSITNSIFASSKTGARCSFIHFNASFLQAVS